MGGSRSSALAPVKLPVSRTKPPSLVEDQELAGLSFRDALGNDPRLKEIVLSKVKRLAISAFDLRTEAFWRWRNPRWNFATAFSGVSLRLFQNVGRRRPRS